jgi:hypothetical protein
VREGGKKGGRGMEALLLQVVYIEEKMLKKKDMGGLKGTVYYI